MKASITIRTLFFARLAESVGAREGTLTLPAGATVADALNLLASRHPGLAQIRSGVAAAVNERYARPGDALSDGDVLALIPPVSGG
jgi:molybdopterin converting factor subunit 1